MTALLVILILVLLIIAHELGHFIAAKLSGVRVDEFGVGYPPRAFLFGKVGQTEYTLNWLLFGGFVRLFGDEGGGERGRGSFVAASRTRQIVILSAGIVMNLLVGFALFAFAFHAGIPRAVDSPGPGVQLLISDVVPGSPADAARIHAGDSLIEIMDRHGASPQIMSPAAISTFLSDKGGQPIVLYYERDGENLSANLIPANGVIPGQASRPGLGIGMVLVSRTQLTWMESLSGAWWASLDAVARCGETVWTIIVTSLHGAPALGDVVGPVGLASVVGQAAAAGFVQVVWLAGFISINLAVINLVPIPALDGGRLVILGAEAILRRRVSKLAVHVLNAVGITLIIVLMVVVTYHDIAHLVA
ncbi:MAG TPA: M50 family metallopeptidase [Candidatus Paceibacterota bacterium]|nr:M50 family metallopeptidase [Candidatus Paceibacterota bacterium]